MQPTVNNNENSSTCSPATPHGGSADTANTTTDAAYDNSRPAPSPLFLHRPLHSTTASTRNHNNNSTGAMFRVQQLNPSEFFLRAAREKRSRQDALISTIDEVLAIIDDSDDFLFSSDEGPSPASSEPSSSNTTSTKSAATSTTLSSQPPKENGVDGSELAQAVLLGETR
eukprot:CAMPEP_0117064322 /NCGR_PEP_ID=MMETSP0472-20121206/44922_1 /TAXON_ID=693140 ORGANISM="Tiarina fusus, Strain LIS" /NCGR_SAMPLE_ID=MMETSP0472 /ASSEMBLY_ACC=CAM_ASM_000603 /LENGTH=169 /DNA_ID=CAMNT_0004784415 /DNA_START=58 /DNA_END=564 /DNA_ORIENTATION=+